MLPRLIGLGHEAAFHPAGWRIFAEELATVTDSSVVIISCQDHIHGDRSFTVSGGMGGAFDNLLSAMGSGHDDDRFCLAMRDAGAGTIHLSDEIVGPDARRRQRKSAPYRQPWPLEYCLCGCITASREYSAYLILGRTGRESRFNDADKPLLRTRLLPGLRSGLRLGREMQALREGNRLMAAVLDTAPDGVVVFDSQARISTFNRRAAQVFAERDGLKVANGRLCATRPEVQAQLDAALAAAISQSGTDSPPPSIILATRDSKRQPYRLALTALPLRPGGDGRSSGRAAMAMIHYRWSNDNVLPKILEHTYGLTRAEIRLCETLFAGQTLSGAATRLRISRNTAKTHLGHVFDKTGLRSQAALMRFLAFGAKRL